MTIVITGGSGFIGKGLIRSLLDAEHHIIMLSRNPSAVRPRFPEEVEIEQWDARTVGPWADRVDGCDAVINLSGESIAGRRWTAERKEKLRDSRLLATRAIVEAIARAKRRPAALVSASGVGYYGDVPEGDVVETSPGGSDFLATLCAAWEREAMAARRFNVRVVLLRTGIVLARDGGALRKMLPPFWLFVGGPLGSGNQWFPWIHRDDLVGIISFALREPSLEGPVIAAAPGPVMMRQFCRALGNAMGRPSWIPVPAAMLRAVLGELSSALLTGQRAVPRKLLDAGFDFRYPLLQPTLDAIFDGE